MLYRGKGVSAQGGGGGEQTPLQVSRHPPPHEMSTAAVGTHPTGMHSCFTFK